MTEPTTQEQASKTTVVRDDPTKVSKPPREDPTRITKKERTEKQLANDRRLAQSSIDRKNKRLEEMKRKKEQSDSTHGESDSTHGENNSIHGESESTYEESNGSTGSMTIFMGGGLIAVVGVILAVWFFLFRKREESALPSSTPEESAPPCEVDAD